MDFVTYGTRSGKERSGAYLFLPDGEGTSILSTWRHPFITITVGPLVRGERWREGREMERGDSMNRRGEGKDVCKSYLHDHFNAQIVTLDCSLPLISSFSFRRSAAL